MTQAIDAADAIRRAAQHYKHFVTAAEILDKIGSLENATEEATKAISALRKDREKAESELATANSTIAQARAEADTILAAAKERAKLEAENIIGEANHKAARIIGDANVSAVARENEAAGKEAAAKQAIEETAQNKRAMIAAIEEAKSNLTRLNEEAVDAEQRVQKAKEYLARLMG